MHEILFDIEKQVRLVHQIDKARANSRTQAVLDTMGKWLVEYMDKARPDGERVIPEPAHKK